MKKIIITLLVVFCFAIKIVAQHQDHKRDYQWVFGYQYATNGVIFDFNSKPSKQIPFKQKLKPDLSGEIAEICDTSGQFFAVSNGCQIYNKDFTVLENSEKLNPGFVTKNLFCTTLGMQYFQASVMLPKPQNDSIIYLFHKTEDYRKGFWFTDTIRLTVINTKGNNGNGTVILKNYPFYNDTITRSQMTAVRHGNGIDWWLVNQVWQAGGNDNRIVTHLITKDSIKGPFIQAIGEKVVLKGKGYDLAQSCFSPDGSKYVRYYNNDGVYYYEFDRMNGVFSSPKFFPTYAPKEEQCGATFSPNSRFLYISGYDKIYQIDTEAKDWSKAIDTVATWDNFSFHNFQSYFSYMMLAPDCKIYVNPVGTIPYITTINYPNRKGKACKVEQQIKLISHTDHAPPNYPNFRLGKIGEPFSPCDSTINPYIKGITSEINTIENPITANLYPNPAVSDINLDLFGYINQYKKGIFNLYDTQGNLAATYSLLQNHDEYRFDISNLANGMYFWHLVLDDKIRQTGKVVVIKE
jgi:hypothetical protein